MPPNPLHTVDDWPPSVVAVGVTNLRRTRAIHGPMDEVFPLASVTKPIAAYAALVAVERRHLDLEEAVDGAPDGATLAHVLAHASGLPADEGGRAMEPEKRRVYSNLGFDLLGTATAEAVGMSFTDWLTEAVLTPLGMEATTLEGSPAKDGHSSIRDLLAFARELLSPTLLSSELHKRATTPQWPDLDGVLPGYGRQTPNPWGLGIEIRGTKSPHWTGPDAPPHTFGHFGQSGSFLWVDREAELACACLTGTPFGEWAVEAWAPFNQAVLDHFRD